LDLPRQATVGGVDPEELLVPAGKVGVVPGVPGVVAGAVPGAVPGDSV